MKIGIMSMQRIVNYGSFLQAYGLKAVLEGMRHQVEFVDYIAEPSLVKNVSAPKRNNYLTKIKNAAKMLSPSYRDYRSWQIRMNQTFAEFYQRFTEEFLPQLGVSSQPNICPVLDALVIGSDEVFNCTQEGDTVGYSLQLFGQDHKAKKLLSYAASFGSTTLEKLDTYGVRAEIGEALSRFDAISVRDDNSKKIVSALCGIVPSQNIDPVLLYEFPEVDTISVSHKDYIIVYAYAGRISEEEGRAIRQFAEKHRKQIITLGYWQPFADDYVSVDPFEVLAYIKKADYIITDTFHGTVFSIKYQKHFATLIRESNRNKLEGLLKTFQLVKHSITKLSDLERVLLSEPNPEVVKILQSERVKAMTYLQYSL